MSLIEVDYRKLVGIKLAEYAVAVQQRLDEFARTRGYDNILSAASYVNSSNAKFAVEGQCAIAARDAMWEKFYEIVAQVESGNCQLPSLDEFIAELPVLQWPDEPSAK